MKAKLLFLLGGAAVASANPSLTLRQQISLGVGAGEIVSFSQNGGNPLLAVTDNPAGGVSTFTYSGGMFSAGASADFSSYFTNNPLAGFTFGEVSSVSLDPLGRGFGLAAILNGTSDANGNSGLGQIGVFDYSTGSVLGSFISGYHPDQVGFSKNGMFASIANEGELGSDGANDNAGSVSLFNFGSVTGVSDVIANSTLATFDFSSGNTSPTFNTNVAGIRSHHLLAGSTFENYLEPEYTSFSPDGQKILVSLQENNAVAEFDIATSKWSNITDLGIRQITIDPSDRDGVANTSTKIFGAPMPDTISTFTKAGKNYVVTANEGDARGDDADTVQLKDNPYTSIPNDPDGTPYNLNANTGGIGRLGLVDNLSDTDGDNIAEQLVSYGTRDVTIWEVAPDGSLTEVSSVDMEEYLLAQDPARHNSNNGGDISAFDNRSDNKGPEPEALAIHVTASGEVYILAGNERQNGLVLIDATDPANPITISYINSNPDGLISPESIQFAEIDGELVAIVGYEGIAGDSISGAIGIYSVPEPSSFMLSLAGLLLLGIRRR